MPASARLAGGAHPRSRCSPNPGDGPLVALVRGVVLGHLEELPVRLVGGLVLEHVEDEPVLDRLPHAVQAERGVAAAVVPVAEQFEVFSLGVAVNANVLTFF
jgi:hypothetical protein